MYTCRICHKCQLPWALVTWQHCSPYIDLFVSRFVFHPGLTSACQVQTSKENEPHLHSSLSVPVHSSDHQTQKINGRSHLVPCFFSPRPGHFMTKGIISDQSNIKLLLSMLLDKALTWTMAVWGKGGKPESPCSSLCLTMCKRARMLENES